MNFKKLLRDIGHIAGPVVKAAAPIVITAVVLHQPIKTALVNALRDELSNKAGA